VGSAGQAHAQSKSRTIVRTPRLTGSLFHVSDLVAAFSGRGLVRAALAERRVFRDMGAESFRRREETWISARRVLAAADCAMATSTFPAATGLPTIRSRRINLPRTIRSSQMLREKCEPNISSKLRIG